MMKNIIRFLSHATSIFVSLLILSGCSKGPDRNTEHILFVTHPELNMIETDEVQVTASPTNQTFTWVSSDPSVATVSSTGLVTAMKDGVCFIDVTSSGGLSRTIPVDVVKLIPVTGIEVQTSLSMRLDEVLFQSTTSIPLVYNERISFDVVWESSDPNTVSVDKNGALTALDFGNVTITASLAEKSSVKTEISVTVLPFTKINVPASLELTLIETSTVKPVLEPAAYNDWIPALDWVSSDPSVVKVTNGNIEPLKPGSATITVKRVTKTTTVESAPIAVTIPELPNPGNVVSVNIANFGAPPPDDNPSTNPSNADSDPENRYALKDNLIGAKISFEYLGLVDIIGITAQTRANGVNWDFFKYNAYYDKYIFTGETDDWDVYYSDVYHFMWVRRDHDSWPDCIWARGSGFTQAFDWNSELQGGSGGYCWGRQKIRFAAYMKRLEPDGDVYQAHIRTSPDGIGWMNAKENLCAWSQRTGYTLIAPAGFDLDGEDVSCTAAAAGYYRVTVDTKNLTRTYEKVAD